MKINLILPHQQKLLSQVIPSKVPFDGRLFPCSVVLKNGQTIKEVYVQEFFKFSEHMPTYVPKKEEIISMADVLDIKSSPTRLPHELAAKAYRSYERWGGRYFYLQLSDGLKVPAAGGMYIDFLKWSDAIPLSKVVDVVPIDEEGYKNFPKPQIECSINYTFCFYVEKRPFRYDPDSGITFLK